MNILNGKGSLDTSGTSISHISRRRRREKKKKKKKAAKNRLLSINRTNLIMAKVHLLKQCNPIVFHY